MRTWFLLCLVPVLCDAAELTSRAPRISQTAAGASYAPLSAGARFVAFVSSANNLGTNDDGRQLDLFLHDLVTGETHLISAGQDHAGYPSFYGYGLVYAGEIDGISHIFAYDQRTGLSTQLTAGSLASPNGPPPNGSSRPVAPPDGNSVVFESSATNLLSEPDTNGLPDLFLRRLHVESNILVSVGAVPRAGFYPRQRFEASISGDGQRVAFVSRNIPVPTTNSATRTEAFVRNMEEGSLMWASTNVESILGSAQAEYVCSHPLVSRDRDIVVFKAAAVRGSANGLVLRHNLRTGQTTVIASNSTSYVPCALGASGQDLMYDSLGQIFHYDAHTGSNELVTVNAAGTGPANGISLRPVTRDGLTVAFVSSATDLTAIGNPARTYQVYLRNLVSRTTRLVSVNTNGQPAAQSLFAAEPQLNASGTPVAFDYAGSDLVADDFNEASDVFVFDASEGSVALISRALPGRPALTHARGVTRELNSLSADGTKVTFTAFAGTNREVFVANLEGGGIEQVSAGDSLAGTRGSQGLLSGNGDFALYSREDRASPFSTYGLRPFRRNLVLGTSEQIDPAAVFATTIYGPIALHTTISHDGNLVVFSKSGHFYLKDMAAGTDQVIAQSRYNLQTPNQMINPIFTPDHRWVLFQHSMPGDITTNQWPPEPQYQFNLFARDLPGNSTILISADSKGTGLGTATAKGISGSGRYIAYDVWLGNRNPPRTNVYVFDFVTRANTLLCSNCSDPSLSADGRLVAYAGLRPGTSIYDIYVRDRAAGTVARIGNNVADDGSSRPLLSADGRYVVFTSKASNYVSNDDNGAQDIFLHDRYRGVTYRLSAGSAPSARHIISKDGRTVVFQSLAGDLTPGDYNEALDIFSVRLGAGDADNDGMDDAWEVTYFNDTTRDGSADLDGDGHSDFQEFLAGTDPTDSGSILEVIAIQSLNPNQVRILWSATLGKHYVVQFKPSLDDPSWTNTTDPITAETAAMSFELAQASTLGFYRVVLVQ